VTRRPPAPNTGSRAAVLRRSEGTRVSSRSDDEVGGYEARSARSERQRAEQSKTDKFDVEVRATKLTKDSYPQRKVHLQGARCG
jgi:hypothetical protein